MVAVTTTASPASTGPNSGTVPHTPTPSHPHTSHPPHSGPMDVSLSGVDTPILEVSELHIDETVGSPTVYQFKLSVVDYRNTTNSTTVFVEFHKGETKLDAISLPPPSPPHPLTPSHPHTLTDPKVPPRADAGPNLTLALPQDTVLVNGSASADDFGIDFYQWSKSSDSPAAGVGVACGCGLS